MLLWDANNSNKLQNILIIYWFLFRTAILPPMGPSVSSLARVFRDQGRFRVAELSYQQVASTSLKFLGNDHELTFRAVEGLLYTFYR
jgi:hypothetical protein